MAGLGVVGSIPEDLTNLLGNLRQRRLAMRGVELGTIAGLLPNSTTALVKRYAHLSLSYLKEAVEQVSAFGKTPKNGKARQSLSCEKSEFSEGTVSKSVTEEKPKEGSRA